MNPNGAGYGGQQMNQMLQYGAGQMPQQYLQPMMQGMYGQQMMMNPGMQMGMQPGMMGMQ